MDFLYPCCVKRLNINNIFRSYSHIPSIYNLKAIQKIYDDKIIKKYYLKLEIVFRNKFSLEITHLSNRSFQ